MKILQLYFMFFLFKLGLGPMGEYVVLEAEEDFSLVSAQRNHKGHGVPSLLGFLSDSVVYIGIIGAPSSVVFKFHSLETFSKLYRLDSSFPVNLVTVRSRKGVILYKFGFDAKVCVPDIRLAHFWVRFYRVEEED